MVGLIGETILPTVSDTIDRPLTLGCALLLCRIYNTVGHRDKIQSTEICLKLGIGRRRYIESYTQLLARAGLVQGIRGPRGGFRRCRQCTNALEIVEAIYGKQTNQLILAWANVKLVDLK